MAISESISMELARDIVRFVSDDCSDCSSSPSTFPSSLQPQIGRCSVVLRRIVKELLWKHEIVFKSQVMRIVTDCGSLEREVFEGVADNMFADGVFNFGRFATLCAFAGTLAKTSLEHGKADQVDVVGEYLADYVSTNLSQRFHDKGGWTAFEETFSKQDVEMDSRVLKGLFLAFVSLGVGSILRFAVYH